MLLKRKPDKQLNSKTPSWFKDFYYEVFKPTEQRASRNEKLLYLILAAVIGLNTAGNYYHEEIMALFVRLFGGG